MSLHFRILFTLYLFFTAISISVAQNFPEKPNTLVNDYTNTLSAEQVAQLEQKLNAFNDSTSTQIAVVFIKSLEGYDVADYAVRLAESWGIGRQKKNNGVLLLTSIGDRKVTIQTGYGIEGALPDAIAKRIIEKEIKPNFREGNYYQGIEQGTNAIIAYTKGEYKNDEPRKGKGSGIPIGFIIFIVIIILIVLSRKRGSGGRVIGNRGGADIFWWTLLAGMGGRSSGGRGWGGFSGGNSDSGGFGGFGGGSFGGGGASGDW